MDGKQAVEILRNEQKMLTRIVGCFRTEHADYAPAEGMMTAAQVIRHIAQTVDWFREGGFGSGFDMDFEKLSAAMKEPATLEAARQELDRAYDAYVAVVEPLTEADLAAPLPENPLFGRQPREMCLGAQTDHTAHHRGALAVYVRLLGITPPLIYGD